MFGIPHIRPVLGSQVLIARSVQHAVFVGVLLTALATGVCHASRLEFPPYTPGEILLAQRAIADSMPMVTPPPPIASPIGAPADDEDTGPAKSTGKAFFMDLLIPGTGHLYVGNKRGWVHLGLEGVTWVTYFYYHDRGTAKENEFEAFADANWDSVAYKNGGTYREDRWQILRDFIANDNMQQYYEDIGKLPDYWPGWNGYTPYPDPVPQGSGDAATRIDYYGMRNDSNNFLKNARYAVIGGFVNRIVSAVDVLRIMKNTGQSKLGRDTKVKFNAHTKPFSPDNALKITITRKLY